MKEVAADVEMIKLKTPPQLEIMRRAGAVVAEMIEELRRAVRPGITTAELDALAEGVVVRRGAQPAFKGYRGFPATICASVNSEVVHGIPSRRRLEAGDIIGLDVGALVDGYYGDAAVTVPVGAVSEEAGRLIQVTEQALAGGIAQAVPGNHLGDIAHAVQNWVEQRGFSVVRDFVGHGIGAQLHEAPQVPNYGSAGTGLKLKAGMVIAIEPMINVGKPAIRILDNGWTAVTVDGSLSAHFEHTVAITDEGPEVLTRRHA